MRKQEFVDAVGKTAGLPSAVISVVLEAVQGEIIELIEKGDSLVLPGFCKIGTKTLKSRYLNDFKTGEVVTIPDRKVPYFTFAKRVKDIAKEANFDL